jgi:hypothetical protein
MPLMKKAADLQVRENVGNTLTSRGTLRFMNSVILFSKTLNGLQFTVFWDATLCSSSYTYLLPFLSKFVRGVPLYWHTWRHIIEGSDLHVWHNGDLKSDLGSLEFITFGLPMLRRKVKIKLSMYTPRRHVGGTDVWFHPFLTSALYVGECYFVHG